MSSFTVTEFFPRSGRTSRFELEAFEFWHRVWKDSYKFFGWTESVYSDQWTRQDSVLVLHQAGMPIGSMFFKAHDLTLPFAKEDTYFRMWPADLMASLATDPHGRDALVSSWFTLHPDWRKERQGVDAKFLLGGLGLQKYMASMHPMLLGTMVTASGMNKLTYELGAKPLLAGVKEKTLEVDLVRWKQSELKNYVYPRLGAEILNIWDAYAGHATIRRAA